jgi:ABC-type polysaccharide/polyol phosphate transport system ATPase subunit
MRSEILVKVESVSKKFCRSLKRSLWYGVQDILADLNPFRGNGSDRKVSNALNTKGFNFLITGNGRNEEGLRPDEFWAVNDVSFELQRGECLGLIGRNGAGKTTLLKMLNGLIKPDHGRIEMRGRVGALIALGAGFNPILTGRENIYVNGAVLGLTKREIDGKIDDIIDFAEIREFIDSPVQSYSSGMQVRLGFSIASAMEPDVVLLDEVLAVGDANFQAKCSQRIGNILRRSAVILVSHYPHHIKKLCNRVVLLERGEIIDVGSPDSILGLYARRQDIPARESLMLLGPEVESASIENVTETMAFGGFLQFDLVLNSLSTIKCDQSYLNIVDKTDIVHAQVHLPGLAKYYGPGESRHRVRIGPLHLTSGHYSGNFMLYGDGGKFTLVHLRHCFSFRFDGPPSLGPVYRPPASVDEVPSMDSVDSRPGIIVKTGIF